MLRHALGGYCLSFPSLANGAASFRQKSLFACYRAVSRGTTPTSSSPFLARSTHRPFSVLFYCRKTTSTFQSRIHTLQSRCFTNSSQPLTSQTLPLLPSAAVGRWLMFSSALVFSVIAVGGITRLTESGLSITEWRPVTGVLPPLSQGQWLIEFTKYQSTPEFKLLNKNITVDDFKKIFYMEWGHRILGRVVGITFVVPLIYFAATKQLSRPMSVRLFGMALLIGLQGALGWYMVKSGLRDALLDIPGAVPRVSQYRLAAHLGTALVLYAGMLGTGLAILKDLKFAKTGLWGRTIWPNIRNSSIARFTCYSWALTALVFLTALSGAFVAGLDAGLLYNEFPLMGGRLAPPIGELFSTAYATNVNGSDKWWRNMFENPTTVQFEHRILATSTYLSTALLWAQLWRPALRFSLPSLARVCMHTVFAAVNVQVMLGIATLLCGVPVPLAAAHQAGSVVVLSAMVHLLVALRGPGAAARASRTARRPVLAHVPFRPEASVSARRAPAAARGRQ